MGRRGSSHLTLPTAGEVGGADEGHVQEARPRELSGLLAPLSQADLG